MTRVTEHRQTAAAGLAARARRAEQRLRTILGATHDTIAITTGDGIVLEANRRWESILGIDPAAMIGHHIGHFAGTAYQRTIEQRFEETVLPLRHALSGKTIFMELSSQVIDVGADQVLSIGRDVTEKIEADLRAAGSEASRRKLEERLVHAQKLDALGQLTGGIAHDFNNILAVILANSCFLLDSIPEGDPRRDDAEQIKVATERAAVLTRQLLAFRGRQTLELTKVDPRSIVARLATMLHRLVGEDIEFAIVDRAGVDRVWADVSLLEQVIVNLVVNARDAMPRGGKLSIEASNVELEESGEHAAGSYVMIAVSDTGSGMDEETKRHLFEPFFTTKERGKGTGLGLSTSYGIVKQIGGHIGVDSDVGRGTVVTIYLPRIDEEVARRAPASGSHTRGTETVLLIEDDQKVRDAVHRTLHEQGYDVLVASGAEEAMELVRMHARPVELIVSDVVMPGGSGPEVVERVLKEAPAARVLLMSGHTDHALLRGGVLDRNPSFLQKPFAPDALVKKVREILGGEAPPPDASASGDE